MPFPAMSPQDAMLRLNHPHAGVGLHSHGGPGAPNGGPGGGVGGAGGGNGGGAGELLPLIETSLNIPPLYYIGCNNIRNRKLEGA